jgi:hypothetical protein
MPLILKPPTPIFVTDGQVCAYVTKFSEALVSGTFYLIADNLVLNDFLTHETEILFFDGTNYSIRERRTGIKINVSGESFTYLPGSGWMRTGTTALDDGTGGTSAGGGLTPAQAETAFINALASQSQVETAETPLEDSTGTVFFSVKVIDEETGAITYSNRLPNGTAYTPVGAATTPGRNQLTAINANTAEKLGDSTYFRVMTSASAEYAPPEYLKSNYVYGATGAVIRREWRNMTRGGTLLTVAPLQTDLKIWERLVDDAVNNTANNTSVTAGNTSAIYSQSLNQDYSVRYKATIAGPGYVIGDIIYRNFEIAPGGGVLLNNSFYNATTKTPLASVTLANIVLDNDALTVSSSIDTKLSKLREVNRTVLRNDALFNNAAGIQIVYSIPDCCPSALYIQNTLAVAAHWVGIVAGFSAVSGTSPLVTSFYNNGSASFNAVIDEQYFNTLATPGFTVVRSTNPLTFVTGSALANPSYIRVLSRAST